MFFALGQGKLGKLLLRSEGFPEQDISSLRALGLGVGQMSRVIHVSAHAPFGVFAELYGFVQEGHTFLEGKKWFRARGTHICMYI